MKDFTINKYKDCHLQGVVDIFNYYVENSFAAYPEGKVDLEYFRSFFNNTKGLPAYVVETSGSKAVGFGALSWYHKAKTFCHTANLTYFLDPKWLRKGIGTEILNRLFDEGKTAGINTVLAHISSLNEISINFHHKHGFVECGIFKGVGQKSGKSFDVVWMQKDI